MPPKQKKTVIDTVDRFHSIPLDKESKPLTTFITESGRFMYLRIPQGYLASEEAYTWRYNEIINILHKVKVVDNTRLYDSNIKESFYHAFDFLFHCAKNGIVLSRDKFQFCQDVMMFRGLQITPSEKTPTESMLEAISNFPILKTLADAKSYETRVLKLHSKQIIVDLVQNGIATFENNCVICLAPNWSKKGMHWCLTQIHANWKQGSINRMGIGKMPHVCHGLP